MRSLLAVAALLLAGAMVWLLARPADKPTPAAVASEPAPALADAPVAPLPAPELLLEPDLTRAALPSEDERKRAALESVPHTSLRVRINDSYGVLASPCTVSLEVRLPTGRRGKGERIVDAHGECWFEVLPAGECELTLIRKPAFGIDWWEVCSKSFTLNAGEPASHLVDLDEELVLVELQCANPPRGGLEAVELGGHAEWTSDDPDAGILPGPLTALVSVGSELEASFRTVDEEYRVKRRFLEPGRQVWRVELPTGELQLIWQPSGGLDKFILESDPSLPGNELLASCFSENGRGSFAWLVPGRYLVRAGTLIRGTFHERARSFVEVGSQLTELTLVSVPASLLRFTLPTFPAKERKHIGGQYNGPETVASLLPAGQHWPVHASRPCMSPEDRQFVSVLAGNYDLVVKHRGWVSITPVTITGGESETAVQAREWIGYTTVVVMLLVKPGQSPPERVELATSEGLTLVLSEGNEEVLPGGEYRVFLASWALPGPAKLTVTSENGSRTDLDLVVSTEEWSEHVLELP